MSRTCDVLQSKALRLAGNRDYRARAFLDGAKRLDLIGVSPLCGPASDTVTRAAQGLGFVASREMHSTDRYTIADHYITSFSPITEPLSDDDPIMCVTWGQFVGSKALARQLRKKQELYGFFGKRKDIRNLVSPSTYNRCYSVGSTMLCAN